MDFGLLLTSPRIPAVGNPNSKTANPKSIAWSLTQDKMRSNFYNKVHNYSRPLHPPKSPLFGYFGFVILKVEASVIADSAHRNSIFQLYLST
jgi:hypothetical protein